MDTRMFIFLFIEITVFTLILLAGLFLIYGIEAEREAGCIEFIGEMQSFEVSHETPGLQYANVKTSERFDDKYFKYLEHIKERRDESFMRGKVFLVEK